MRRCDSVALIVVNFAEAARPATLAATSIR